MSNEILTKREFHADQFLDYTTKALLFGLTTAVMIGLDPHTTTAVSPESFGVYQTLGQLVFGALSVVNAGGAVKHGVQYLNNLKN